MFIRKIFLRAKNVQGFVFLSCMDHTSPSFIMYIVSKSYTHIFVRAMCIVMYNRSALNGQKCITQCTMGTA